MLADMYHRRYAFHHVWICIGCMCFVGLQHMFHVKQLSVDPGHSAVINLGAGVETCDRRKRDVHRVEYDDANEMEG